MDAIFLSSCVPKTLTTLFRPLGPYQVAWYLRENGYDVQVLEFVYRKTEEEIFNLIKKFSTPNTKVLGMGLMINLDDPTMGVIIKKIENVLRRVRLEFPQMKIITGGPAAPIWSRLHRNKTLFDYIINGHGEDTVLALMNHLYKGSPHPQFEIIDGNKYIRESFKMPLEKFFDITKRGHRWHKNDCIQPNESLPLELGRGCIFKCKFCRYPYTGKSKNDFTRDMKCVKEELIENYNNWGVTNYYMLDDTFNADQSRMKDFYNMTQTLPFKIKYATYLRTDLLHAHPDTQYMLLESGLKGCYLGIETFNQESADLISKSWSPKAKEYLPKLHFDIWKDQVNTQVGFIAGLPPETYDDLQKTNQWCMEHKMSSWVWHALSINRDAHYEFKSDFDLNAEKYGFRWVVNDGKPMWVTDYCTREQALQWEIKLKEESKIYQRLGCWYLMELGNYGYDIEVMRWITQVNMPWKEINVKRYQFLTNYFNDLAMLV